MSTPSSSAAVAHPERAALRRSISNTLKGSAGNLVEWYDVYVYSVFAVYFESQFFSAADKNSTMYVWAIFAATFLMRPIGAWYFGRFADRYGRRLALTVSVTVMAGCSFLIAITPTASQIGIWAAVILLFARLLQASPPAVNTAPAPRTCPRPPFPAGAASCPRSTTSPWWAATCWRS